MSSRTVVIHIDFVTKFPGLKSPHPLPTRFLNFVNCLSSLSHIFCNGDYHIIYLDAIFKIVKISTYKAFRTVFGT